jgi:DNA modification methylase
MKGMTMSTNNVEKTKEGVGHIHKALTADLAMHGATLVQGDSREKMAELAENSVDCVVSDPPYGMSEKEPNAQAMITSWLSDEDYSASSGGLLNQEWDSFVPSPALWKEALRVVKPGGHLLAFASSRTIDLTTLALRLAGFEIRDGISWHHNTGMPLQRGIKLKASHEPIVIARKPMEKGLTLKANSQKWGVGYLNDGELRIGNVVNKPGAPNGRRAVNSIFSHTEGCVSRGEIEVSCNAHHSGTKVTGFGSYGGGTTTAHAEASHRPGHEMLEDWACVDGCPVQALNQQGKNDKHRPSRYFTTLPPEELDIERVLRGELPGFAFCTKPGPNEREAGLSRADFQPKYVKAMTIDKDTKKTGRSKLNVHTTVKPLKLMSWLIKLCCPEGGLVLDPFNGSGSTGCAAVLEGRRYIGIDLDSTEGYLDIAAARICHWGEQRVLAELNEEPVEAIVTNETPVPAIPMALAGSSAGRISACQVGFKRKFRHQPSLVSHQPCLALAA